MKKSLGILFIAALAAMPLPAHDCCGHGASHHGGPDCCDPPGQHCWRQSTRSTALETLQGTVAEINSLSDSPIVEVWLKSGKDTTLVRLAPDPFLKQNGVSLKPGVTLAVRGYRTGGSSDLFVARELEWDGKSVVLRGERGRPSW
jgi:hypothetical protein